MSSTNLSETHPNNVDPYSFLGLLKNPDGSFTRVSEIFPTSPPSSEFDPNNPLAVLSKDLPINQEKKTWARLYLPARSSSKLPLIVYFHGGGFVVCSAATSMIHKSCNEMAEELQAVIVSVEYRSAPEHRLPAAYEDCVEALDWIKVCKDDWLVNHVDFSKCFLMGSSAGGNIAYEVGLRVISTINDDDLLGPIKIRGLILVQPFFGGVERTPSEVALGNKEPIPLYLTDLLWDLGLPVNADRDHEYCNPMMGVGSGRLEMVKNRGWRVLVSGCKGDSLVDAQIRFVDMLKEKGIDVVGKFRDGGFHGIEVANESEAMVLYGVVKEFVSSF